MKRKDYWKQQSQNNNRFYLIVCAAVLIIEAMMVLVYFTSQGPGFPNMSSAYLGFYIFSISISVVFGVIFFFLKHQQVALQVLHLAYLIILLLWSSIFAVYDVSQGNNAYVFVQILIFTSAGIRMPNLLHCSLNFGAFLCFLCGILTISLESRLFYNELLNVLILTVLSCAIVIYSNRLHYANYRTNYKVQKQNAKLARYARYDELTGLLNRRMITDALEDCLKSGQSLCCVMLDVDDFKIYNDTYGHLEGDQLLKKLAEMMVNQVSPIDAQVGRFGGEEFMLLFSGIPREEVIKIMEKVCFEAARLGLHQKITVSAGGCMRSGEMSAEQLVSAADKTLYQVKCTGKKRFEMYQG